MKVLKVHKIVVLNKEGVIKFYDDRSVVGGTSDYNIVVLEGESLP